jgi:hypothetical protein
MQLIINAQSKAAKKAGLIRNPGYYAGATTTLMSGTFKGLVSNCGGNNLGGVNCVSGRLQPSLYRLYTYLMARMSGINPASASKCLLTYHYKGPSINGTTHYAEWVMKNLDWFPYISHVDYFDTKGNHTAAQTMRFTCFSFQGNLYSSREYDPYFTKRDIELVQVLDSNGQTLKDIVRRKFYKPTEE